MVKMDAGTVEAIVRQVLEERMGKPAEAARPALSTTQTLSMTQPVKGVPKPMAGVAMAFWQSVAQGEEDATPAPQRNAEMPPSTGDREAQMRQMRESTTARIGIGRAGPRLTTKAMLALRADHAAARDCVMADADEGLIERLGMFTIQTLCRDKNEHLTRPDLGRQFSKEALDEVRQRCTPRPQAQIYVSDGLNALAIDANIESFLGALQDGLAMRNISQGTLFYVRYGRVPAMDTLAEVIAPEVMCVLIGERPGLGGTQSMSAYLCYRPTVGMPESRRTVISNIHKAGTPAAEAGAYTAELIETMLREKCSGVDLKL